jgi:uncharacterized protein (DUF1501 family)
VLDLRCFSAHPLSNDAKDENKHLAKRLFARGLLAICFVSSRSQQILMATQAFISGTGEAARTLVVVFLRGGADGLSLVAPLGDDDYYKARPRIGIAKKEAVALDGFFGLHPMLRELEKAWKDGELAIVHGAGSEDVSRSHFEAQDLMEHGGIAAGGWLARFLRYRQGAPAGALGCVAVGATLPECLLGAPSATVMRSLDDFSLGASTPGLRRELQRLYALEKDGLGAAAHDTFDALSRIDAMRAANDQPANGAEYPSDSFAQGLRQITRLIKADVGLEAASIDVDGWDSHFAQGTVIEPRLTALSKGLAAFRRDLGARMASTTVVVMTEFGRRVRENSAFGTDHGRGSVMFILGGGVRGGRVHAEWPGLRDETLDGPGDLPVLHNYRDVLSPILQRHGASPENLARIFPDFDLSPLPLYA